MPSMPFLQTFHTTRMPLMPRTMAPNHPLHLLSYRAVTLRPVFLAAGTGALFNRFIMAPLLHLLIFRYHGATYLVSHRPSFCHLCLELDGYMFDHVYGLWC